MMLYIVVFDGQAIFKCVKKVSTYNQSHIRLLFLDEYVDTWSMRIPIVTVRANIRLFRTDFAPLPSPMKPEELHWNR